MSPATAEPPVVAPETEVADHASPEALSELTPILSQAWALSLFQLGIVLFFCVFFMYHNYVRIFHSDVWGHVAYGNWIIEHGRLPTEEPFVPLAAGVPVFDTAWLGQVLLAGAVRVGEPEWLVHVFALTALATYLTLTATYYYQTRQIGVAVLAMIGVFLVGFGRHAIVRPEIFGCLSFAVVIWLVARADSRSDRRPESFCADPNDWPMPWFVWLGVPLVFAMWANLHGSFIVGIALLGCYVVGRAWDVLWETGEPIRIVRDRTFLRWTWLTELALLGTLANPHGMDLLVQTLLFPSHPNLKEIIEWYPLQVVSLEGPSMVASWVLIAFLLRQSKARMTASDVLLLLVFNAAVCLRVRMIAWYGPVLMLALAPHLADALQQAAHWKVWEEWRAGWTYCGQKSLRYTLVAVLFVWVAFALSPISRPVLGGKPRPDRHVYSRDTPLALTEYLQEHPPQGLVAAPQWWGDWLALKGPPEMNVMMTTNSVHVAPPTVWKDYLAIAGAAPGLEARLNRYRINTIIVCKSLQADLLAAVDRLSGWEVTYEDDVALVAVRTRPDAPASAVTEGTGE
jgi:hypothetical protein